MLRLAVPLLIVLIAAGFPNVHLPGVPGPTSAAEQAAASQMSPFLQEEAPITLSADAAYPTVDTLPGGPFHGAYSDGMQRHLENLMRASTNGMIDLAPGDYVYRIRQFCMAHSLPARAPLTFVLTPIRGKRAPAIIAMNSRAAGTDISWSDLQATSWAIQSGAAYGDFSSTEQAVVNRFIPEYKDLLQTSTLQDIQNKWNSLSIPGLPSLNDAVGGMGSVGQTILDLQAEQQAIIASGSSFTSLTAAFIGNVNQQPQPATLPPTPWSIVAPHVYMRLITNGHYGDLGDFQIRVVGTSDPSFGLGGTGARPKCWDENAQTWTLHGTCTQPMSGYGSGR